MKQVIVVRKDLNARKGKMIAQGAHASLKAILDLGSIKSVVPEEFLGYSEKHQLLIRLSPEVYEWMTTDFKKIVVGCDSQEELMSIYEKAKETGVLPCSLILDLGLTEFSAPTYTAVAVGPGPEWVVDEITGHLKLL